MLSSRLAALAKQVPLGSRLVDVGTDHGLIPVYLAKNKLITRAIATDISDSSLQKARDLVKDEDLGNIVETRLGSGLQVIKPGEADVIMIAGMGGLLIRSILDEGQHVLSSASRLIIQPMNGSELVRRWLVSRGFAIEHEVLVRDGKHIYEIIIAVHGYQEKVDDIQYEIGFRLMENKDPLFKEFICAKITKARNIIKRLENQDSYNAQRAMREFALRLKKYEEAYKWFVQSIK